MAFYVIRDIQDSVRDRKTSTMLDIFDYIRWYLRESYAWVNQPKSGEIIKSKCGRYELTKEDGRSVKKIRLFES